MENGQSLKATGTQDNIVMKSVERKELPRSRSDIMTWRLKNRERQRRYRARKRLEADMKKASSLNQSAIPQERLEHNGNFNDHVSIVRCNRNWKKDARRAHACKTLEEVSSASTVSVLALDSNLQMHRPAPPMTVEPPLVRNNYFENLVSSPSSGIKVKLGRRDWKAEARRKKN